MGKTLIVAEKPAAGQDIAKVVGAEKKGWNPKAGLEVQVFRGI